MKKYISLTFVIIVLLGYATISKASGEAVVSGVLVSRINNMGRAVRDATRARLVSGEHLGKERTDEDEVAAGFHRRVYRRAYRSCGNHRVRKPVAGRMGHRAVPREAELVCDAAIAPCERRYAAVRPAVHPDGRHASRRGERSARRSCGDDARRGFYPRHRQPPLHPRQCERAQRQRR